MKLPVLKSPHKLVGMRVFLRVDWNVPLSGGLASEDSLKLERSLATVKALSSRGAIVLVATHLGRPKKREAALSTKKLLPVISKHKLGAHFLAEALDTARGLKAAQAKVKAAKQGSVFLLENVRFYAGEEKNDPKLAKAYASLAEIFMNDAFASCHRSHASVVGIAKYLPSFAGPTLCQEVTALDQLVHKPKRPFVAVVGGAKLSTKIPVLKALLKTADKVLLGGAMANVFFLAQGKEVGTSLVEKTAIPTAKRLMKDPKLVLPLDAVVAHKIAPGARAHAADIDEVGKDEAIGDIGPKTMQAWAAILKKAKTIAWNGPVGVTEIPSFAHGSMVIARVIASRAKGTCFGVAGGGDTLPVVLKSGMAEWYDHLSTGGGAMLEFLAEGGSLPGLTALIKKK